jgi:hypothetical protein
LDSWIARTRALGEKEIAACARSIASAHPRVKAALPIKLSCEMLPQLSKENQKNLDDSAKFSFWRNLSASYSLLITTTDNEQILVPLQPNLVGSHPIGQCSWKDLRSRLPGFNELEATGVDGDSSIQLHGAGFAWQSFNTYDLWDVFKDSPILCISDAFLLFTPDTGDTDYLRTLAREYQPIMP